jgi:MFS family permease
VPGLSVTVALGFVLLPLTSEFYGFAAVGVLTGIGNGFGSGINMTLGADFAPAVGRGEFLGVWRVIADLGASSGPIVTGVLTGLGSLALASFAASGIGFAGALVMLLFVPETLTRPQRLQRPKT